MTRPTLLIARRVFDDVVQSLREHFDVRHNDADATWSRDDLIAQIGRASCRERV